MLMMLLRTGGDVNCIRRHNVVLLPTGALIEGDEIIFGGSRVQRDVKNGFGTIGLPAFSISAALVSLEDPVEVSMRYGEVLEDVRFSV